MKEGRKSGRPVLNSCRRHPDGNDPYASLPWVGKWYPPRTLTDFDFNLNYSVSHQYHPPSVHHFLTSHPPRWDSRSYPVASRVG